MKRIRYNTFVFNVLLFSSKGKCFYYNWEFQQLFPFVLIQKSTCIAFFFPLQDEWKNSSLSFQRKTSTNILSRNLAPLYTFIQFLRTAILQKEKQSKESALEVWLISVIWEFIFCLTIGEDGRVQRMREESALSCWCHCVNAIPGAFLLKAVDEPGPTLFKYMYFTTSWCHHLP